MKLGPVVSTKAHGVSCKGYADAVVCPIGSRQRPSNSVSGELSGPPRVQYLDIYQEAAGPLEAQVRGASPRDWTTRYREASNDG